MGVVYPALAAAVGPCALGGLRASLPDHKNRCNGPIFVLHALFSAIATVPTGMVTRVVLPPTGYAVLILVAFCHLCAASIVCRQPHS